MCTACAINACISRCRTQNSKLWKNRLIIPLSQNLKKYIIILVDFNFILLYNVYINQQNYFLREGVIILKRLLLSSFISLLLIGAIILLVLIILSNNNLRDAFIKGFGITPSNNIPNWKVLLIDWIILTGLLFFSFEEDLEEVGGE